jgi:hypothetical protein
MVPPMPDHVTMTLSAGKYDLLSYVEYYTVAEDGTVTMEVTEYEFHSREVGYQLIHEHKEHNICLRNTPSAKSPPSN